jgi:hypothetical protein
MHVSTTMRLIPGGTFPGSKIAGVLWVGMYALYMDQLAGEMLLWWHRVVGKRTHFGQ